MIYAPINKNAKGDRERSKDIERVEKKKRVRVEKERSERKRIIDLQIKQLAHREKD